MSGHMCIDPAGSRTLCFSFATLVAAVVLPSGVRNTLFDASFVWIKSSPTFPTPEDAPVSNTAVFLLILIVLFGFSFHRPLLALRLG